MTEQQKIEIDLSEIRLQKLSIGMQIKVFLFSIVLVNVALITHIITSFIEILKIPSRVVDIITLGEKTKKIIRRKVDEQIKT